ncbi:MAG TPA: barstar family protein [Terriglobales bacterium]
MAHKGRFHTSFLKAIGAPDWHGRNLDALNDSIATGEINAIELPYRIVIRNSGAAGAEAQEMIGRFASLIEDISERGCAVSVTIEP